jgi:predicted nucleic acid-binding protein
VIVLDTSVLSMVFRRTTTADPHPATRHFRKIIEDDRALAIPGVVFQELLSGVKTSEAFARLEDVLGGFPLLLADRAAHLQAARVRNLCRGAGIAAASFDCLIAAQTLQVDGELFTLDEDFTHIARVTGLKLSVWDP